MTVIDQRVTPTRLLQFAETLDDGPARTAILELAGKWRHGYIPLDAVAWAIKMKHQRGDGKRRSGIGAQGHLEPYRPGEPRPSAGKRRTDVAEQTRNLRAATGSRAKQRLAPRSSDATYQSIIRRHDAEERAREDEARRAEVSRLSYQATHGRKRKPAPTRAAVDEARKYTRKTGGDLRALHEGGDRMATAELARREAKRAAKATPKAAAPKVEAPKPLPTGYRISNDARFGPALHKDGKIIRTSADRSALERYAHDHAAGDVSGHPKSFNDQERERRAAAARAAKAPDLAGMTPDQLVAHGRTSEENRQAAIGELKRRQAANAARIAVVDRARATNAADMAQTKRTRKPSKLYQEYLAARQEQDRRYENQQDSTGAHDVKSEEYQRYFGLGEHMGNGTEQRVTYKSFLESRRASPEEKAHQAAYDAGRKLGRRHGARGTQPADSEYDSAASGHDGDSFAGGFNDGVIHGDAVRQQSAQRRAAAKAAKPAPHPDAGGLGLAPGMPHGTMADRQGSDATPEEVAAARAKLRQVLAAQAPPESDARRFGAAANGGERANVQQAQAAERAARARRVKPVQAEMFGASGEHQPDMFDQAQRDAAVAEAERTGHVGTARLADLAVRRSPSELRHLATSNPNSPEGRVAAAELRRRGWTLQAGRWVKP